MKNLNVSLSDPLWKEVQRLKDLLDLPTSVEVLREGVRFMAFISDKIASGQRLLLQDEGSDYMSRLVFPRLGKYDQ